MAGKIRNFYSEGNTAKGFYNFYDSSIQGLEKLLILKGGTQAVKSFLIKQLSEEFLHKGYDIELLNCALENGAFDGIIIPSLKMGIIDGTPGHTLDDKSNENSVACINLDLTLDSEKLIPYKDEIENLKQLIDQKLQKSYSTFGEALKIHDEWEKVYLDNISFDELNNLTDQIIGLLFSNKYLPKKSKIRDMFFGAATPNGPVDFIENLTQDITKRYFIKGRPGSGKSTLLKKLAVAAQDKGFDVEVYHCGFDPDSLDMLIFPELSTSIFDSTAPHEYFPSRESDEIIDVYECAIVSGTDEKYDSELKDIISRYSKKAKEATSYLAEAKSLHDKLEEYYSDAIDYNKVSSIKDEIFNII